MTSIASSPISIQTSECSAPLPPPWFGEVVLIVGHLRKQGVLDAITQRVRFARRRFGRYARHRLCGRPVGLRDQRRTHPGSLLSSGAPLGGALQGAVRPRETALPLGALARSFERELGGQRSLAHALSQRSARMLVFPQSDTPASWLIEQATPAWS
jgi:hypothetical protein